jgi:hypothetical protein
MQEIYVGGSLSAIAELTRGEEIDELKAALSKDEVRAVNLFEAARDGEWHHVAVVTPVSQKRRRKRKRRRKMAKASRKRNR